MLIFEIIDYVSAPYERLFRPMNYRSIKTLGISDYMTMKRLQPNHVRRDIDAIVFDGPTNEQRADVIRFPDNDDDIDLSGSFTPSHINTNTHNQNQLSLPEATSGTFANCGAFAQNGAVSTGSTDSGIKTFPNGTQVLYSKCEIVQTVNG